MKLRLFPRQEDAYFPLFQAAADTSTAAANVLVDLPARDAYAAVIDHVIACCQGRDSSRLSPASVLDTLKLTLDARAALTSVRT